MELHWFYKAWRIRAARDQKARKVALTAQNILRFRWKSWFLCKKFGIAEKSSFCALPKRWYSLSFFQSARTIFKVPGPFHIFTQKVRNFIIFSISGPKSALFGPESVFWEPGSETFINTSFWEVFWRPRTEKVRFGPKKLEISLQNRIFVKKVFFAQKVGISRKLENVHETLPFLL